MSSVKLADLSTEDRESLVAELKADQEAADEKDAADGEFVYTNATSADLTVPDLGIATPNGSFEAMSFKPFEVRDLAIIYSPEEIRKSKYLRVCLVADPPMIVKGAVPREKLEQEADPLAVMVRNNPDGTFQDPLSASKEGEYGSREYDIKLKALADKDRREDMETRKG